MKAPVLTIGHSTRRIEDFLAILRAHRVARLVDVRTVPRSRRHPQFNRETLPATLAEAGIAYTHMPALGGLRKPRKDSLNGAWRNESFRGYADHMQSAEFEAAVAELMAMSEAESVAIMCAEAVHFRCHRSLIADALSVRGAPVFHITGKGPARPHTLTPFAKVQGTRITYPAEQPELGFG